MRKETLETALNIVLGQRATDYGTVENNFRDIADLWEAYKGAKFSTADVAIMMTLMKIARLKNSPTHQDSWVDIAGYAACGSECVYGNKEAQPEIKMAGAEPTGAYVSQ